MSERPGDLAQVIPPTDLPESERRAIFLHVLRRLASHRNTAELYAATEYALSSRPDEERDATRDAHITEITCWAQELLGHTWAACQEPGGGGYIDFSIALTLCDDLPSIT